MNRNELRNEIEIIDLRDAAKVCRASKQDDVDENERRILEQAAGILESLAYLHDPTK